MAGEILKRIGKAAKNTALKTGKVAIVEGVSLAGGYGLGYVGRHWNWEHNPFYGNSFDVRMGGPFTIFDKHFDPIVLNDVGAYMAVLTAVTVGLLWGMHTVEKRQNEQMVNQTDSRRRM